MKQSNLSTVGRQFKRVFSEETLNQLGKSTRFCQRQRAITPYRLALGLIDVFTHATATTIADVHRGFNALCATKVKYKPFHNQLAKERFPEFMRKLCEQLMNQMVGEVLRFDSRSPFSRFSHLLLHDGTSFGLKSALQDTFPGRFTTLKPAAVELHVTLELLSEGLDTVVLTPDTDAEVAYAPAPQSLRGGLLLADRMFFVKQYLADITAAGGHYLVKTKGSINPVIRHAYRPDGREIKSWSGKKLNDIKGRLHRYAYVDMTVEWSKPGVPLCSRLIVTWNKQKQRPRYLVTNLARDDFSHTQIIEAYRLRWQIELLFKEWKSHANLQAFDTANPFIAEGLIWASLCTAILKRYWAHTTQRVKQVCISTQKVAMCIHHVLPEILKALMHRSRKWLRTIQQALDYLAVNAQRAHPQRDKHKGRLKLGLEPVFDGA